MLVSILRIIILFRGSHRRCSVKEFVLKSFANFTEKHLCWSLFLIKIIKKRLQHRCFPVKFADFLTTTISKNICKRLLLSISKYWLLIKLQRIMKRLLYLFALLSFDTIYNYSKTALHLVLPMESFVLPTWQIAFIWFT